MKLPRISPGGAELTRTSPEARQTQAGETARGMQSFGGAVKSSADFMYEKLDQARNYTELSQAKLKTAQGMAQILVDSESETGENGLPKTGKPEDYKPYNDRMTKMREEVAKGFTNKEVRDRYLSEEFDMAVLSTRAKLTSQYRKNIASVGDVSTKQTVDNLKKAYALDDDTALKEIEDVINEAQAKTIYNAKQA